MPAARSALALTAAALALTACGSATTSHLDTSTPSPPATTDPTSASDVPPVEVEAPTPTAPTPEPTASVDAEAASCSAFGTFYDDLLRLTPHAQVQLNVDAAAVQAPLDGAAGVDSQFVSDVSDLVADVGSSAFPDTGNIDDPPIQQMQQDCGQ